MKKKWIKLSAAAALAAGMFMGSGWSFFEMMVHCRRRSARDRKKWFKLRHMQINHPRNGFEKEYEEGKAWCRQQKMTDCFIKSEDGLTLHASYLPAASARRTVLLSHGYRGSGFGDFAGIARFLHENGCSLLFIDQRCCGESGGEYITFGAKEQYDVVLWARYLDERCRDGLPIYLFGESMGAAAVLMASGHELPHRVRGLIADCGFCSMKEELQDLAVNWFHLPRIDLLLLRVDLFCRLLAGFRMKDADTEEALAANRRPVLFFHGGQDTFVYPKNSQCNYARCRAPKELVTVPEARHLCSAYAAPELYREKLLHFFAIYDG